MSEPTQEQDRVTEMPLARASTIVDFLRFHLLIHGFDGDVDRWFAKLLRDPDADPGDIRFVRSLRSRLRRDPSLLATIRAMVGASSLFPQR